MELVFRRRGQSAIDIKELSSHPSNLAEKPAKSPVVARVEICVSLSPPMYRERLGGIKGISFLPDIRAPFHPLDTVTRSRG